MSILSTIAEELLQGIIQGVLDVLAPSKAKKRRTSSRSSSHSPKSTSRRKSSNSSRSTGSGSTSSSTRPWDMSKGLPTFSYEPHPDGDADPGEVVWTWVPFEEDASQGKDRPVVVLGRNRGKLIVAQMTSKDHVHDRDQEAHWGRYWVAIGSGPWDRQGRKSSVRINRLLVVNPDEVRREGATMDKKTYDVVVNAITQHHRSHR
ncbi:type II toxin-antitoxin system PemK/MazF family toxin [Actinomyces vulturis]|uniref:type II toxin-antitoxin system PemK/MazF family toxin n=1 Tax=Actinomyces vulturis TaxID=1857645 RepID=UPI000836052D|nr:type II toxin-antitoxin system PemK/MazF family toxin [Actinomyces vulturis]